MKKLLTVVCTMLLAGTLAFAQAGGGTTDTKTPPRPRRARRARRPASLTRAARRARRAKAPTPQLRLRNNRFPGEQNFCSGRFGRSFFAQKGVIAWGVAPRNIGKIFSCQTRYSGV